MEQELIELAEVLLDDDQGISAEAFDQLYKCFEKAGANTSILDTVRCTEGRFYLPSR